MTSRERIDRLLRREPVDRIPFGLGGCETAGFHLLAYDKIKRLLGVDPPKNRMCTFMTNAVAEPEYLEKAEGDVILLTSKMCASPLWTDAAEKAWKELRLWGKSFQVPAAWNFTHLPDGSVVWENTGFRCPASGFYFDEYARPADVDVDDIDPDSYRPPKELPEAFLRLLEKQAEWLYQNTDYAIACGESIVDLQVQAGSFETWMTYLALEPEGAKEFLEKACEAGEAQLRQLDQAIGKYCSFMGIAHDFGDASGVMIGANRWREIYKPYYKKLFQAWKSSTRMKISLHSCGAIAEILPDLVECGVDMLNPVQVSCPSMDPETLKARFGDSLVFYGGSYDAVSCPVTLGYEEVYARVRQNIETFSRGGGYLFAAVHNLPADVPEHHLRALLDAYYDCRDLPELR